jgi:hypothetical protein
LENTIISSTTALFEDVSKRTLKSYRVLADCSDAIGVADGAGLDVIAIGEVVGSECNVGVVIAPEVAEGGE